MAKLFVKRLLDKLVPDHDVIKQHKHLQFLGDRLHEPNLWHLNRHSVARGFAVGLACAWIPLPTQMVMAAAAAVYFRANIPLSVALVWLTNPVTMPPLFYFAYRVGLLFTAGAVTEQSSEFSFGNIFNELGDVWQPFLLGCFILGVISSAAGYFGIHYFWHAHVVKKWKEKKGKAPNVEQPFRSSQWRLSSKNRPDNE